MLLIHPGKIPFVKRFYAKKGYDPVTNYKIVMDNPVSGFSTIFAGVWIALSLGLFFSGLSGFFCSILKINLDYKYQIIIVCGTLFLLCEFFIWRNDKEVKKEFKKFDKMSKARKVLWGLITLAFIVIAIFVWWKGMTFWSDNIENY